MAAQSKSDERGGIHTRHHADGDEASSSRSWLRLLTTDLRGSECDLAALEARAGGFMFDTADTEGDLNGSVAPDTNEHGMNGRVSASML